jgi:hypothetical protein
MSLIRGNVGIQTTVYIILKRDVPNLRMLMALRKKKKYRACTIKLFTVVNLRVVRIEISTIS